ncbi:unnamed protein product [marine sediment metagenome]|uniref:Uncharacterized protein n=1 Tax=marine sediment metagenome TaxID=412755 RepID=X1DX89_9ZZZZ
MKVKQIILSISGLTWKFRTARDVDIEMLSVDLDGLGVALLNAVEWELVKLEIPKGE